MERRPRAAGLDAGDDLGIEPRPAAKTNQRGVVQLWWAVARPPRPPRCPARCRAAGPCWCRSRSPCPGTPAGSGRRATRPGSPRSPRPGRGSGRGRGRRRWWSPPGRRRASAGAAPGPFSSRPLTTSLTVPSPPTETTRSMPSAAAWAPSSRAWPRWAVSTTSSFSSLARAPTRTSRILAVVLVAAGLTTTSARMAARLTRRNADPREDGATADGGHRPGPRNLAVVTSRERDAAAAPACRPALRGGRRARGAPPERAARRRPARAALGGRRRRRRGGGASPSARSSWLWLTLTSTPDSVAPGAGRGRHRRRWSRPGSAGGGASAWAGRGVGARPGDRGCRSSSGCSGFVDRVPGRAGR